MARKVLVAFVCADLLALAMCRPAPSNGSPQIDMPARRVAATDADAGSAQVEPLRGFAFAGDGTLLAYGSKSILARSQNGVRARYPLAESTDVFTSQRLPGVILHSRGAAPSNQESSILLATPTLRVLYEGQGRASTGKGFVAPPGEVLMQHGDALLRLALPPEARAYDVAEVARGSRLNVSFGAPPQNGACCEHAAAFLYDAGTGAKIGRGLVVSNDPLRGMHGPSTAFLDMTGFGIDGRELSRVDLQTGNVERRAIVCPKDAILSNPIASPKGDLLLVTCGVDGRVLDGVTLKELRRIPSMTPGCIFGEGLPGRVAEDGHTLIVQDDEGEAKVDLHTGRYVCGDSYVLLGGVACADRSESAPTSAPPGRRKLPRCTPRERNGLGLPGPYRFGHSGRYRLRDAGAPGVEHAGGTIVLEDKASPLQMAPDERSFAYWLDGRVILRDLPTGSILAELP